MKLSQQEYFFIMSSLLNFESLSEGWKSFFMSEEVSKILERNIKHLERRRSYLRELDKNIWPDNCQLLDVFEKMPLEKINKIILLPHPYPYDSGTGIPVMICNERKPTVSLNNILKAFSKARTDNFNELWEEGSS